MGALGCFGMMYVEQYGVCNCVSIVEMCVDYGGVYVFHVCFLRLGVCCCGWVGSCEFCLWRCSFICNMCVSSCRCCVFVAVVHPVIILSAVLSIVC